MNRSEHYQRTESAAKILMEAMDWLDVSRYAMTDATDAKTDQVDSEIRDAMQMASKEVEEVLSKLIVPIWNYVPSNIRESYLKLRSSYG